MDIHNKDKDIHKYKDTHKDTHKDKDTNNKGKDIHNKDKDFLNKVILKKIIKKNNFNEIFVFY